MSVAAVVDAHRSAGRFYQVSGLRTFVREEGSGQAVLCLHGVPTSSFLYRKVIASLSLLGFRGLSFDFPGLGLSDRPDDFNYSFRGLLSFTEQVVSALKLSTFHLVVHDIGGPIGFALAGRLKEHVLSLTILNTWIDVVNFQKPWPMRPFSLPLIGELQLAAITHATWYAAFSLAGISDKRNMEKEEAYAYVDLLKREDNGRAFLRIMRNFDYSAHFKQMCFKGVAHVPYEVQAIWGVHDPGLTLHRYGKEIRELVRPKRFFETDAKHLLPEDQSGFIAEKIAEIAAGTR